MAGTLIYNPGVTIVIESRQGLIDISDDIMRGEVTLRENGAHRLSCTFSNPQRKYDGLFTPNDRIVCQMKRFRWLQIFAGYLDSVPMFSSYAKPIDISASCPLKSLMYWPWDPATIDSQALLMQARDRQAADGGVSEVVVKLLNEVALIPKERIHIGRMPGGWELKYKAIKEKLITYQDQLEGIDFLGENPIIAGKTVGGIPPIIGGMAYGSDLTGGMGAAGNGGAAVLGQKYGAGDMQRAIVAARAAYQVGFRGQALVTIVAIAGRESRWTPTAHRTTVDKALGSGDRGMWQINYVHDSRLRSAGIIRHWSDLLRPDVNAAAAFYLSNGGTNFAPWNAAPGGFTGSGTHLYAINLDFAAQVVRQAGLTGGSTPITPSYGMLSGSMVTTASVLEAGIPAGVKYPIPAGVDRLRASDTDWTKGRFRNAYIPLTSPPMAYSPRCGWGHPIAIRAFDEMAVAAAAEGIKLTGGCYRDASSQNQLYEGGGSTKARAGQSLHGWGLAVDIAALVPGNKLAQPGNNDAQYASPTYQWLVRNAYKWGWGHPVWGRQGGSYPEAWHWEWFAIHGKAGDIGVNPMDGVMGAGGGFEAKALFNLLSTWSSIGDPMADGLSATLPGYKALMNDQNLLPYIASLLKSTGRNYCSAPNGDFISWFPDYWGEYGLASKMEIKEIELQNFSINWSDAPMITHQYVLGSTSQTTSFGPVPQGMVDAMQSLFTKGVVTVDMPGVLEAILSGAPKNFDWMKDPAALLRRFGARVSRQEEPLISGPDREFWMAVSEFTTAWAEQFSCSLPTTFMPEVFPGMILQIPFYKVQVYAKSVTHRFDLTGGGESNPFTTTVESCAPAAMEGSKFLLLPKAGGDRYAVDERDNAMVSYARGNSSLNYQISVD